MESLKRARDNIGIRDIRNLDSETTPLLERIKQFINSLLEFSEANGSNCSFFIKMIGKQYDQLCVLLLKSWNTDLLNAPDNIEALDKNNTERKDEEKDDSRSKPGYVFKLATPLKQKTTYQCSECPASFTNGVVYKRHAKKKHELDVKVDLPKVKCLLTHQRGSRAKDSHPMNQICTHLKDVSNNKFNQFLTFTFYY